MATVKTPLVSSFTTFDSRNKTLVAVSLYGSAGGPFEWVSGEHAEGGYPTLAGAMSGAIEYFLHYATSDIALIHEQFICEMDGPTIREATFPVDQPEDGTIEFTVLDSDSQGVTICLSPNGTWSAYPTGG